MTKNIGYSIVSVIIGLSIMIWIASLNETENIHGLISSVSANKQLGFIGAGVYGFSFTLIGVVLGSLYRKLAQLKKQGESTIKPRALLSDVSCSIDFYIGLIGAPLIFGLLWQSIGEMSLSAYTIVALENGFVANALVAQFADGKPKVIKQD